jgi:hypothetical protein
MIGKNNLEPGIVVELVEGPELAIKVDNKIIKFDDRYVVLRGRFDTIEDAKLVIATAEDARDAFNKELYDLGAKRAAVRAKQRLAWADSFPPPI